MQDSIFTKIRKGQIPGEIIYQDDVCFVLLTIQPFTEGHMLVIPNEQIDSLWDVDDQTYQHLFDVSKQMQTRLSDTYPDYKRIGLLVEGFGVPHAHIHVFGFHEALEETLEKHTAWKESAEGSAVSGDVLRVVAEKLRVA